MQLALLSSRERCRCVCVIRCFPWAQRIKESVCVCWCKRPSKGGFKFRNPGQPECLQWPQPCFLSDKHPQVTVGTPFLLFISTCAISGIPISAAAEMRQSDGYIKNWHGRTGHFRLHTWKAPTGVCRPPRLVNKDTNFSASVFSGEQGREQTGEVKAAERSQGHFNL